MKEKNNLHHMHIELTREQYATLCAKAKKSGLTKRVLIARLLEGGEISGYENSAAKCPERLRRFRKAVPGKRSRCSADRLVLIQTNRSA